MQEESKEDNKLNIDNIDTRLKLGEYIAKNKGTFPFELSKLSEDKDTVVIYFKHLRLGQKGAVHLAVLLNFFPRLQRLNLADNSLLISGMISLAPSIAKLTNLQELHLELNFIREGARSLGSALKPLTKLEVLNVADNEIDAESLTLLCEGISYLNKLRILKMNFNSFKTNGSLALAKALPNLTDLTILQLYACQIETDGALAFFDAFKQCRFLKSVLMGNNGAISSRVRKKLKSKYNYVHFGIEDPPKCSIL